MVGWLGNLVGTKVHLSDFWSRGWYTKQSLHQPVHPIDNLHFTLIQELEGMQSTVDLGTGLIEELKDESHTPLFAEQGDHFAVFEKTEVGFGGEEVDTPPIGIKQVEQLFVSQVTGRHRSVRVIAADLPGDARCFNMGKVEDGLPTPG